MGIKSTSRKVNTGVPQRSKLSPSLFSFYIADMPRPTDPVKRVCYADDLISQKPRGHHRQKTKLQETNLLHKAKKTDMKMNLSTELTIGRQRKYFEECLHINYTINTGVRSSYLRNDGPYQHRQVTGIPESRDTSYSVSTTSHKCQDDETRTSDVTRGTQSNTK